MQVDQAWLHACVQAALRSQSPALGTGGSTGLHRSRADIHRLSLMSQATRGMFKTSSSDDNPLNPTSSPDALSPEQPGMGAGSRRKAAADASGPGAQAQAAQPLHAQQKGAQGNTTTHQQLQPAASASKAADRGAAHAAVAQASASLLEVHRDAGTVLDCQPSNQHELSASGLLPASSVQGATTRTHQPTPAGLALPGSSGPASPSSPQSLRQPVASMHEHEHASPAQPSSSGTDHSLIISIGNWGTPQKLPGLATPQSKPPTQQSLQQNAADMDQVAALPLAQAEAAAPAAVTEVILAQSQGHAEQPGDDFQHIERYTDERSLSRHWADPSAPAAQSGQLDASDQAQRSSDVNISSSHVASPISTSRASVAAGHASQAASQQGTPNQPASPLQILSQSQQHQQQQQQQQQQDSRSSPADQPEHSVGQQTHVEDKDEPLVSQQGKPAQQFSLGLPAAGGSIADDRAQSMPAADAEELPVAARSQASQQQQQPPYRADTGQPEASSDKLSKRTGLQAGSAKSHEASPRAGWHRFAQPPPSQASYHSAALDTKFAACKLARSSSTLCLLPIILISSRF